MMKMEEGEQSVQEPHTQEEKGEGSESTQSRTGEGAPTNTTDASMQREQVDEATAAKDEGDKKKVPSSSRSTELADTRAPAPPVSHNPFGISENVALSQQGDWIDRERLQMQETAMISTQASNTPPSQASPLVAAAPAAVERQTGTEEAEPLTINTHSLKQPPDKSPAERPGASQAVSFKEGGGEGQEFHGTQEGETENEIRDDGAGFAAQSGHGGDPEDEKNAKREYNRVCAAKSRAKRKRTLSGLHSKVDEAASAYTDLQEQNKTLREDVGTIFQAALSGFLGTSEESTTIPTHAASSDGGQATQQATHDSSSTSQQGRVQESSVGESSRQRSGDTLAADTPGAVGPPEEEDDRKPPARPGGRGARESR